jgi:hypothetical protein
MNSKIIKLEILGIFFFSILGSVLHYTYGWSGGNQIAGVFSAVNESTWEHLKLAAVPAFIFSFLEYFLFRLRANNFWLAKTASLILIPVLIAAFFYSYKAILGYNLLALDISIFVLAVIIGQLASIFIMTRRDFSSGLNKIFILLILALFSLFAFFTFRPPDCFLFEDPTIAKQSVTEGFIIRQDEFYNINVRYPQITEADAAFNAQILQLLSDKVELFKVNAMEAWEARKETALPGEEVSDYPEAPFDFICQWSPVLVSDGQINFVLDIYYYEGGAHGMNEVLAFNYDLKEKRQVSIIDFLDSSQESLIRLSELAIADVIYQLEQSGTKIDTLTEEWVDQGAGPDWKNYENFNFNEDSLIVYFQRYQVVFGAFGSVTVILPKAALQSGSIYSPYF